MAYVIMRVPDDVIVGILVENQKIRVVPDRVRVERGQPVRWVVLSFDGSESVSLEVYFDKGSPFPWTMGSMTIDPSHDVDQPGATLQPSVDGAPRESGEYKYGVRMRDAEDKILDDEDPYITVV